MARSSLSDLLSFLNCGFPRLSLPFCESSRLSVLHAVCACARAFDGAGVQKGAGQSGGGRAKKPDNAPEVIQDHAPMRMTWSLWFNAWVGWSLLIQLRRPHATVISPYHTNIP